MARTRRRRKNPGATSALKRHNALRRRAAAAGISSKGTTAQLSARLGGRAKRKNPIRRKKRRARRNPAGRTISATGQRLTGYAALRAQAKNMGIKASGSKAQLQARVKAARTRKASGLKKATGKTYGLAPRKVRKRKPKAVAAPKKAARRRKPASKKGKPRRKKKLTRAQSLARARSTRRTRGKKVGIARRILKSKKSSRHTKGIARTYMAARGISGRVRRRRLGSTDAKLARAMGLTRINPSFMGAMRDVKNLMVPVILPGFGGFVGIMAASQWLGTKIAAKVTHPMVQRAAVPVTGLVISGAAFAILKATKNKHAQMAAMPVLVGGAIGSLLLALLHSQWGQSLAAKLRLPITFKESTPAQAAQAVADGAKDAQVAGVAITPAMVGAYLPLKDYMGAAMIHETPGNYYGRTDMGGYVGAGGQTALGAYAASNYPVHDAGPGDNIRNSAKLLGGFSGGLAVQDTPGGTRIVPLGGAFDGESALG